MATTSETDGNTAANSWVKLGVYATSIVFNVCLIAQVLTVGVAYFTDPAWWTVHVWLVQGYSGLSLLLLGGALIVPLSDRVRSLAVSLPVLLGLQFCTIHLKTPLHLEILHPLIGFTLFYISSSLVHYISPEAITKLDSVAKS